MKLVSCRWVVLGLVLGLTESGFSILRAHAEVQSWVQASKGSPSRILRGIREMERKGVPISEADVKTLLIAVGKADPESWREGVKMLSRISPDVTLRTLLDDAEGRAEITDYSTFSGGGVLDLMGPRAVQFLPAIMRDLQEVKNRPLPTDRFRAGVARYGRNNEINQGLSSILVLSQINPKETATPEVLEFLKGEYERSTTVEILAELAPHSEGAAALLQDCLFSCPFTPARQRAERIFKRIRQKEKAGGATTTQVASGVGKTCCICQTGTDPEEQVGFFNIGCDLWLGQQSGCDYKLKEPFDSKPTVHEECRNGQVKLGYVGHGLGADRHANTSLDVCVGYNCDVSYDDTACNSFTNSAEPMSSHDHRVLKHLLYELEAAGVPNKRITLKGNQCISTGMWPLVKDTTNLSCTIDSQAQAVSYPGCSQFVGGLCMEPGNTSFCSDAQGGRRAVSCCQGGGATPQWLYGSSCSPRLEEAPCQGKCEQAGSEEIWKASPTSKGAYERVSQPCHYCRDNAAWEGKKGSEAKVELKLVREVLSCDPCSDPKTDCQVSPLAVTFNQGGQAGNWIDGSNRTVGNTMKPFSSLKREGDQWIFGDRSKSYSVEEITRGKTLYRDKKGNLYDDPKKCPKTTCSLDRAAPVAEVPAQINDCYNYRRFASCGGKVVEVMSVAIDRKDTKGMSCSK